MLSEIGEANINGQTTDGYTPLMLALKLEYSAITKLLLDKGETDMNRRNSVCKKSLLLAAQYGRTTIVKKTSVHRCS